MTFLKSSPHIWDLTHMLPTEVCVDGEGSERTSRWDTATESVCWCWRFWQCDQLQRWPTGQRCFGDSCSSLQSHPADRLGASSAVSSPPVCDFDLRHESGQGNLQPRGRHIHKNPYFYSPSFCCLCLGSAFYFSHFKPVPLGQCFSSASTVLLAYTWACLHTGTRVL